VVQYLFCTIELVLEYGWFLWWFNIIVTNLRKLKSQFLSKPLTMQLGTRVLTNFEKQNLAPSLLNFVSQAVPVPLVFLNYYRPGLLFTDFGDAKTLVRWTRNHIWTIIILEVLGYLPVPSPRFTPRFLFSRGGLVSHLQGFPTFRVLASTRGRVPKYICPHKAEVSKRQY
jgi:hypothetical protein